MTAQAAEKLIYKGEQLSLCNQPLGPFIQSNRLPFKFEATSTALWRGYIGTWAIEHERLYLIAIHGGIGMEKLFPGFTHGVFAHWYTGTLRCPRGALLKYVHDGFRSVYEEDLFFDVSKGVVSNERLVRNGTAAPDAAKGYTLAAATSMGD